MPFVAGLPDLIALRQVIQDTLSAAGLLGLYIFPDDTSDAAIAVVGLGSDQGEESYPPTGTRISGLEVVIIPGEEIPPQDTLDGYIQFFRTAIVLKQWDTGINRTLPAYQLLQQQFGNIYTGSVTRILPQERLGNIETLSFSLETNVLVELEGTLTPTMDSQPETPSASFEFTQADLTLDKIVLTHNLNKQPVDVSVFDEEGEVYPYNVRSLSPNTVEIDLTGLTPITGTWRALVER